jgi:hypothetical protein
VGQKVEAGRLAGAVGPDQRVNRVAPHAQIDVLDRYEPPELLRQTLGLEDCFLFRRRLPRDGAN